MEVGQFDQVATYKQEPVLDMVLSPMQAIDSSSMEAPPAVVADEVYQPANGSANSCPEISRHPPETEIDANQMHIVRAFQTAASVSTSLLLLPDTNIFLLKTSAGVQLLRSLLDKAGCFVQWPGLPHPVQVQNVIQIQVPYIAIHELNRKKDELRKTNAAASVLNTNDANAVDVKLTERLISQSCELINEYHRMLQLQSFDDHSHASETFVARYGAEYRTNDSKILATAVYLRDLKQDGGRLPVIISNDKTFGLMAKTHKILAADVANLYQLNGFIHRCIVTPSSLPPSPPMSVPVSNNESSLGSGADEQKLINSLAQNISIIAAAQSDTQRFTGNNINRHVQHGYGPAGSSVRHAAIPGGPVFYDSNQLHHSATAAARHPPPRMRSDGAPTAHYPQRPPENHSRHGPARPVPTTAGHRGHHTEPRRFNDGNHHELSRRSAHDLNSSGHVDAGQTWETMYPLDNTPQNLLLYKHKLTGYLQELVNDVIRLEIYTRALEQSHLPSDVIVEESKLTEEATMWLTYTYSENERKGSLPNVLEALGSLQKHNRALLDNYARELNLERLLDSIISSTRFVERATPYDVGAASSSSRAIATANDLPKCKNFKDVHRWGSEVFPLIRALTHRQPPWSPSFIGYMRRTPQVVLSHYRKFLDRIKELCEHNGISSNNNIVVARSGGGAAPPGAEVRRLSFGGAKNYHNAGHENMPRRQRPNGIAAAMDVEY